MHFMHSANVHSLLSFWRSWASCKAPWSLPRWTQWRKIGGVLNGCRCHFLFVLAQVFESKPVNCCGGMPGLNVKCNQFDGRPFSMLFCWGMRVGHLKGSVVSLFMSRKWGFPLFGSISTFALYKGSRQYMVRFNVQLPFISFKVVCCHQVLWVLFYLRCCERNCCCRANDENIADYLVVWCLVCKCWSFSKSCCSSISYVQNGENEGQGMHLIVQSWQEPSKMFKFLGVEMALDWNIPSWMGWNSLATYFCWFLWRTNKQCCASSMVKAIIDCDVKNCKDWLRWCEWKWSNKLLWHVARVSAVFSLLRHKFRFLNFEMHGTSQVDFTHVDDGQFCVWL